MQVLAFPNYEGGEHRHGFSFSRTLPARIQINKEGLSLSRMHRQLFQCENICYTVAPSCIHLIESNLFKDYLYIDWLSQMLSLRSDFYLIQDGSIKIGVLPRQLINLEDSLCSPVVRTLVSEADYNRRKA